MEEKRNEQVSLGIATRGDGLDWAGFSVKTLKVRSKPFARLFNTYGQVQNKTSQHLWFGSTLQGVDRYDSFHSMVSESVPEKYHLKENETPKNC